MLSADSLQDSPQTGQVHSYLYARKPLVACRYARSLSARTVHCSLSPILLHALECQATSARIHYNQFWWSFDPLIHLKIMNDSIGADRRESITLGYPEAHDGQRSQHRKQASERFKWSRMQSMMYQSNGGFQRQEPIYAKGEWIVPSGYNYAEPTNVNYAAPPEDRKECFGQHQAVRRTRDFEYHGTYSRERQLFQG